MSLYSNLARKFAFFKYNISPFRASLLWRHSLARISSLLGRKKGYRIIDLALTYECNLFCQHCSAKILNHEGGRTLNLDDYRNIVSEAKKLDVLSWNITGGEPLLVPWLYDLIPILEPKIHYISIQTNCMLLDQKTANRLAKLGVNCITTSIDSIEPGEHNSFRGHADSYKKVLEGVRCARKAGMQILMAGTVTHDNLRTKQLSDLIEKSNAEGAIFLFNLAIPCGNWKGKKDGLLRGDDREYLNKLLARYPKTSTDHEVGRNEIGCPSGIEKCYITPFGEVIPCPFIHVSFGNVTEEPLTAIVKRMQENDYFGHYQKVCIAAEDTVFQDTIMKKIGDLQEHGPVDHTRVYGK
jgi:MoaA/NifB/PqqE/SkfB family radical SAM enzyme